MGDLRRSRDTGGGSRAPEGSARRRTRAGRDCRPCLCGGRGVSAEARRKGHEGCGHEGAPQRDPRGVFKASWRRGPSTNPSLGKAVDAAVLRASLSLACARSRVGDRGPRDVMTFDIYSADAYAEAPPHSVFAHLRRTQPVFWQDMPGEPGYWAVLKHADVALVSKQPHVFSA